MNLKKEVKRNVNHNLKLRRQLQKTGLEPDVPVRPTIQGIRDGKEEVLDQAVEYLKSIMHD